MMCGGGSAEILVIEFGVGPWRPIPVIADPPACCARLFCPVVEKHKPKTCRCHQPLLTGRHHHVDAPIVHFEPVTAQRRNAVRHQQRRVPQRVQHRANGRRIVTDAGGCIHMHRQHRLDLVRGVLRQNFGDPVNVKRGLLAEFRNFASDPQRLRHAGPTVRKLPRGRHQHCVAFAQRIDQCSLPRGVAIANVNRNRMVGARDRLQIGDQCCRHIDQFAFVNVGRRAVHGAQHGIRNDRRPRNSKIVAPVRQVGCLGHVCEILGILGQLSVALRGVNIPLCLAQAHPAH